MAEQQQLLGDPNTEAREAARQKAYQVIPTYLLIRYETDGDDPRGWVHRYRAYIRKKRAENYVRKLFKERPQPE